MFLRREKRVLYEFPRGNEHRPFLRRAHPLRKRKPSPCTALPHSQDKEADHVPRVIDIQKRPERNTLNHPLLAPIVRYVTLEASAVLAFGTLGGSKCFRRCSARVPANSLDATGRLARQFSGMSRHPGIGEESRMVCEPLLKRLARDAIKIRIRELGVTLLILVTNVREEFYNISFSLTTPRLRS